jgi:glutaredoxin 3
MAKRLLGNKGQEWVEINLDTRPEDTEVMLERSDGRMTVPQIFIDGKHIGGFDDLAALETSGELDPLLIT